MCNMSFNVDHSQAFQEEQENQGKPKQEICTYARSPTSFCAYFRLDVDLQQYRTATMKRQTLEGFLDKETADLGRIS